MTMETMVSYFETRRRDSGEEFVTLVDGAPAWLRDAVMAARDDEVPNDWRYDTCAAIWGRLEEFAVGECGDDEVYEMADGLTDIYTNNLTAWLASNLNRVAIVDEALDDGLWERTNGIAGLLATAQCRTIEQMAMILRDARDEHEVLSD